VLNHAGLPADRSPEGLAGWRVADQARVVLDAIAIFGARRCMFASNFPVDGLVGSYATIMNGWRAIVAHLPAADQRALFWENAHRAYRIDGP